MSESVDVDAIVVGAGFAGMYMMHSLRSEGYSVQGIEQAQGVGGTWYWNRYPGARCDVESIYYSYSFDAGIQQEWEWSEKYATQPEILAYANFVAERLNLSKEFRFGATVVDARFDEVRGLWGVTTDDGTALVARFCVMATGVLSSPKSIDIPGIDTFEGKLLHTDHWPVEAPELEGKRIGVIGTGSSGIQVIPIVARLAEYLAVFQRTPSFTLPARNRLIERSEMASIRERYPQIRADLKHTIGGLATKTTGRSALEYTDEERQRLYSDAYEAGNPFQFQGLFNDIRLSPEANETAAEFVRSRIRETVTEEAIAAKLMPRSYPFATRRLCLDTDYYETYNRSNVTLVDLFEQPITAIGARSIETTVASYPIDVLILATGFDAFTGALGKMNIVGRGGVSLREHWADGASAYLGVAVAGFPNLFIITGPGSPSVFSNMIHSIEQHVEFISGLIEYGRENDRSVIETSAEAEWSWMKQNADLADGTLFAGTNSWYTGANVAGKPRTMLPYIGGVSRFRETCERIAAEGYEGFVMSNADEVASVDRTLARE